MARWNLDYFAGEGEREEIEQRLGSIAALFWIQRFEELTLTIIAYDPDGTQLDTLTIDAPPDALVDTFGQEVDAARLPEDVVYSAHLVEGRYDEPTMQKPKEPDRGTLPEPPKEPERGMLPEPKQDERGRYLPGQAPTRGAGGRFVPKSGAPKRPYVPVAERRRRAEERKKEKQRRRRNELARKRRAEKKRAGK